VLVREYQARDDVRRIHWPSTARTGSLMVRREEAAWDPTAWLLLDSRAGVHPAVGSLSPTFEALVSAAASLGVRMLRRRLRGRAGGRRGFPAHHRRGRVGPTAWTRWLDPLVDAGLTGAPDLLEATATLAQTGGENLIIALLGSLDRSVAEALVAGAGARENRLALALPPDRGGCGRLGGRRSDPHRPRLAGASTARQRRSPGWRLDRRRRCTMSYPWRVTLALIASFWLLLWPWNQLTQDAGTLLAASLTATAVLLVGGAAHRLAVPWPQLLALLTGGIGLIATVTALAGPAAVLRLPESFVAGLGYIQSATAPVPANIGVSVIIVGATVLLAVLASALTLPTRQPALGILPLISLYLVPSVILVTSMLFSEFCLLALACVALLWAGSAAPRGSGATKVAALVTTIAIAAASVGVTYAVAQLFPPLEPQRSQEPLQMNDPSLDLKRNLVEGTDDVVLTYQTPTGEGEYLKLATLPAFSDAAASRWPTCGSDRAGCPRCPATPLRGVGAPHPSRCRSAPSAASGCRSPTRPPRVDALPASGASRWTPST
jgi:hypothetical protein